MKLLGLGYIYKSVPVCLQHFNMHRWYCQTNGNFSLQTILWFCYILFQILTHFSFRRINLHTFLKLIIRSLSWCTEGIL